MIRPELHRETLRRRRLSGGNTAGGHLSRLRGTAAAPRAGRPAARVNVAGLTRAARRGELHSISGKARRGGPAQCARRSRAGRRAPVPRGRLGFRHRQGARADCGEGRLRLSRPGVYGGIEAAHLPEEAGR
jgi:hypothetical protein